MVLTGTAADRIATAAGADTDEAAPRREVGCAALLPQKVEQMQANLQANPPRPFDITRKMNVFASRVQYVELSVANCQFTTRQVPLPADLVGVADDALKDRINSRIRAPFENVGKVEVTVELDGKTEKIEVDDSWLKKERKRIDDDFTFQVNNFGRVILSNDREKFDAAVARFKAIIEAYRNSIIAKLDGSRTHFKSRIVKEFAPRWTQHPPKHFERWGIPPTEENIRKGLEDTANGIFNKAVSFDGPKIRVVYEADPEWLRNDRPFGSDISNNIGSPVRPVTAKGVG